MRIKDYTYLAGPMEDVSQDAMTGWRQKATAMLGIDGIQTLDPTRRVSFHDQLEPFLEDNHRGANICKRIFKQDLQDIAESKVILADVRRESGRGTGTACELMFGHTKNKIIILWAGENDFPHPFLYAMATEIHYELEDAIEAVKTYY